jgi:transposase
MNEISMIGLDLAKRVFQVHCADAAGELVLGRRLRRGQVLSFFARLSPCVVGMEACASAHYWARELEALGHEVRLVPPAYVKPFVKRGRKNDAADAAAILRAMASSGMHFVPVKATEDQAGLMLHRARQLLVRQRTQLANALRAHLAELGIVAATGDKGLKELLAVVADAEDRRLPAVARTALALLAAQLEAATAGIAALEKDIRGWYRASTDSQRLATVPGIGPVLASAITATVGEVSRFRRGRDFAAWLGLVPSQHSTGGKTVLGSITKMGDRYLRSLFLLGATAMLRRKGYGPWLAGLIARKPARKAAIALANKMARIAWAMLAHGGTYRAPAASAV